MSKVFTRKDIEILTFKETFNSKSQPRHLYKHLKEL